MMKKTFVPILIAASFLTCLIISSCEKEHIPTPTPTCDIRGTYSGTNHSTPEDISSTLTYTFKDNNFAVGSVTPTGPGVTFGGYRNTCDSVFISVHYSGNDSYYLLEGKLTNNGNTIIGTFKNLTITSDYGTFSISK